MVNGVEHSQCMTIHQTLHGYSHGHREIARSVTLQSGDLKLMLVLSDISGSGTRIGKVGYLTGYPLAEQGAYVLARTWPAPEMSRPGCVWTHSVLIDFADLALVTSLGELLSLFRRPEGSHFGEYERRLMFIPRSKAVALTGQDHEWSRHILASLYCEPSSRIIASWPVNVDVDRVVLALWSQQWPRLRRAFRFCTQAVADRSNESTKFDLQILPPTIDRSARSRFPDATEVGIERANWEPWLVEAETDLAHPDASGLRTYLRRAGGDGATARWAFRPLCQLYRAVKEFRSRREAVGEAVALLQGDLGSLQIREMRAAAATTLLRQGDPIDDNSLDFLLAHLELVEGDEIARAAGRVGREIWGTRPSMLALMLQGTEKLQLIPKRTFEMLSLSELTEGLQRAPSLARAALAVRPDLVAEPAFWDHRLKIEDEAFSVLIRSCEIRPRAVAALVTARREDLATRVADQCGTLVMLDALGSVVESDPEREGLRHWIATAVRDRGTVARYLVTGPGKPRRLLVAIARALPPDSLPNEIGKDPWLIAADCALGRVSERSALYFSAFLFSRALGPSSRNAAELAQLEFDAIHEAAALDQLDEEAWRLLDPLLPSSGFWREWDRCRRIRAGLVHLFVDRNLEPRVFAQITTKDQLFEDLALTAVRYGPGRRYLKRVCHMMRSESKTQFSGRIQQVEKLLEW